MRTLLVTGSDTGVGKTRVVAALARLLAVGGARVQLVKVVETGRLPDSEGDAAFALRLAGVAAEAHTLASFTAPLAPATAAALERTPLHCDRQVAAARALPECDWRIYEGAGGIATPLDDAGNDWVDFAVAAEVDALVIVVPDRLGAINQARLAFGHARRAGIPAGVWLNATTPVEPAVAQSTRVSLRAARVPVWAEQAHGALVPVDADAARHTLIQATLSRTTRRADTEEATSIANSDAPAGVVAQRCREELARRDAQNLRRHLRVTQPRPAELNLADNDYLALARDPAVVAAVAAAAATHGASASASPLITGWRTPHAQLVDALGAWHGFPRGLLWSSGYAANAAVLGGLPGRGDLVFADRLIHASMIAGLRRSGARLQRYEHLRLDRLEALLASAAKAGRNVFVVTETVFSMDGDYPDLARMAELKRRFGFFWIVDEAHGLGWYGPRGAGLIAAAGAAGEVDVLVGTLGKALASGGAYTLFRDHAVADTLLNTAGEFVYSTSLPPTTVAAAHAALERLASLAPGQTRWHETSREFRGRLRHAGWAAPPGESPIVPVILPDATAALELAERLRAADILVAAVRPPTVPAGTSRLRFSLKRTFGLAEIERVIAALGSNVRTDRTATEGTSAIDAEDVLLRP